MPFTNRRTQGIDVGRTPAAAATKEFSASAAPRLDEVIPIGTNTPINFSLDVSACISLFMLSDVEVQIKTNSTSMPSPASFTLRAGKPYTWPDGIGSPLKFPDDIAVFYVTANTAGRLRIEALADATP